MDNKNILVVGGGTAGWLAALKLQLFYPQTKITLVASEEIGILGAGEGTVPLVTTFLNELGISVSDIVKNCSGTIKLGIEFKNWQEGEGSFLHGFSVTDPLDHFPKDIVLDVIESIHSRYKHLDDITFNAKLIANKKTSFSFSNTLNFNGPPEDSLNWYGQPALHFDANKLAAYLKDTAVSRGITYIDAKVTEFKLTETQEISAVALANGSTVETDFVVDCSGFARLVVGGVYKEEWISYSDKLPVDTAIPFFIPHDNDVAPSTEAIAMKYGWVWKIPVQDRYGCGYVFDSNYTDKEAALAEAEEYFGIPLSSPREFKFNAGRYKNTLVKNCLALGLAQSFIEPLEATSIYVTCAVLNSFCYNNGLHTWDSKYLSKRVNTDYANLMYDIAEFIHMHYITNRKDTAFWRDFSAKHPLSKQVLETIEQLKQNPSAELSGELGAAFPNYSWVLLLRGLGHITYTTPPTENGEAYCTALETNQNNMVRMCMTHKEFIEYSQGV